jgi:nucleoredoxin
MTHSHHSLIFPRSFLSDFRRCASKDSQTSRRIEVFASPCCVSTRVTSVVIATTIMSTAEETQQPTLEELLGPSLLTNAKGSKKATREALKDKDLVLLYFSASWCPPCSTFSPLLIEFYNKTCKDAKLEVIYVASDRTVDDFKAYYGKMPWLALPSDEGAAAIKNSLAEKLKITGIPTLVVLDKAGNFVTDQARSPVTSAAADKTKCMDLCNEWKKAESVPLDQAKLGQAGNMFAGGFMGIVMAILKNPMYIFGMIYIVKWIMRQIDEMRKSDGALDADKEL